jgi:hypothetical protein
MITPGTHSTIRPTPYGRGRSAILSTRDGRFLVKTALIGTLLAVGATLGATGVVHAENAMYSCADANGVVSLTNVPTGSNCEKLFSYAAPAPEPAAAPAATAASAPTAHVAVVGITSSGATASTDASDDGQGKKAPMRVSAAQRRDDAIAATRAAYAMGQPMAAGNPAVNRRYLMTTRADYQRAYGVIQP